MRAQQQPGVFRNQRSRSHARYAPIEDEHKQHRQHDVHHVDEHLNHQRQLDVTQAIKPAEDGVSGEHGGHRPDADQKILACVTFDFGAGVDHPEREPHDRQLQRHDRAADHARQQQCPRDHRAHLGVFTRAARLRRRPSGAHAQTVEQMVEVVEQHRADGHCADVVRLRQMADHGGIHRTQQRHGDIGQNDRPRQRPYLAVGVDGRRCR